MKRLRIIPSEVKSTELAWLAGIIDGEGTIGAYFYAHQTSPKYGVWMVNSSKRIIAKYISLMKKFKLKCWIAKRDYYRKKSKDHRYSLQTKIGRRDEILKFLKLIEPYLIAKRPQAITLIKFLEKYPSRPYSFMRGKALKDAVKLVEGLKKAKETDLIRVETKR